MQSSNPRRSYCDVNIWPNDIEPHFGCHAFKLCTKFERNRIIHGWVIDNLARFRRAILGGGACLTYGSQGSVDPTAPNLARTPGDHRSVALSFQTYDILPHFQKRVAQSWVMLKTTPNFALLYPLWKLGEGWARFLYQLLKLDLTSGIHLMAINCAAAEHSILIKKKVHG